MAINLLKVKSRHSAIRAHYDAYIREQQKELSHYVMPERGRFRDTDTVPVDGKKLFTKVIDHTTGVAAGRLASGLLEGLSSPTKDWVELAVEDTALMELTPVKNFLFTVEQIIKDTLQKTPFYNVAYDAYEEQVVFGIGTMSIEEDPIDVVRFKSYTAGTYYVSSDSNGTINRVDREYSETAQNLFDTFGEENVSERIKLLVENNHGHEHINVVHVTEPNVDRDITQSDNENMPFTSVYYEETLGDDDKPLRVSGFEDFPYVVPRWRKVGTEDYGVSPCMRALGTTKALQEIEKDFLRASKKTIDPPVNKPEAFKNKNMGAGGVNLYDGAGGNAPVITPVHNVNYDFNANLLAGDKKREMITKILHSDLFAAISNIDTRNMTATEITQRVAEAIKSLIPFIARENTEFLRPVIELVYKILLRAGRFPEPPEEIEGSEIKVVFISSLAQAQKAIGISEIEQLAEFVIKLAGLDPTVLDKFDAQQALDEFRRMNGAPPSLVRSDEDAAEIAAERDRLAQQDRTAGMLGAMAEGAESLGNAPISDDNMLGRVVGGAAGG